MNLFEFKEGLEFWEQIDSSFYVVDRRVECYWCKEVTLDLDHYRNVRILGTHTPDDVLKSINIVSHHGSDSSYVIVTSRNMSTYHCRSCKKSPHEVTNIQLEEYKRHIIEAAKLVQADLGVKFKIRLYNKRGEEGGYAEKDSYRININIGHFPQMSNPVPHIYNTVAHEARHIYQFINNPSILDNYIHSDMDAQAYLEHPSEVDAREYADLFVSKHLGVLV